MTRAGLSVIPMAQKDKSEVAHPIEAIHSAILYVGVGSRKGQALRDRPQVAVSIVSTRDPWHWVSVSGRVVDIQPDQDLEFIDRMSQKYVGRNYERRTPREIFTIAIDRVSPSSKMLSAWTRST